MKSRRIVGHKAGRGARRRGIALLYAVFAAFVAAGMVTILMSVSRVSDKMSGVKRYGAQAQYLAEGAVEAAKKQMQTSVANWSAVPATGSVTIDGTPVPYTITPTGFVDTATDPSGIQTLVTQYEIRATVGVQNNQVTAHRLVNSMATPIFQFAVFYSTDLEINPGPNMTLTGRVHTNANMYLGTNAASTLTVNTNYVRAAGQIFRNRKDDPSASTGIVKIRKWVANPWDVSQPVQYVNMHTKSVLQTTYGAASVGGYDSQFTTGHDDDGNGLFTDADDLLPWGPGALANWQQPVGYTGGTGNTVQDSSHGVGESTTPSTGSMSMFEPKTGGDFVWNAAAGEYVAAAAGTGTHTKGYYHANAGLTILTRANGTWKAYNGAGVNVTSLVAPAVTQTQLYDARQAGSAATKVKVTNIDMAKLKLTGQMPANGLIYAAHYGEGTGTNAKGIKISNAAVLPSKLTIVSEDPVYLHGDFNKGDASNPVRAASVIGDAVNLLSNAWDGTKTNTSGVPAASNTVYNAAMVSGNTTTSVGGYNGGLENLPRFHENWSGKSCTIKGSFVNLFKSRFATGAWGSATYSAPNRVWSYDTAFNSVANLPPFTPMAVTAEDVVSW